MRDIEFGNRLKRLRKQRGLTQVSASQKIGPSYKALQDHEGGRRPNPNNLKKYLNFYGCDEVWLITGRGRPFSGQTELSINKDKEEGAEKAVDYSLGKDKKVLPLGFPDKHFIQDSRRWSDKIQEGKVDLFFQAGILILNILSSDNQTIIQSTIANLRAFSQAIDTQQKNRIKKLEERLAALEEALRSGDPYKIELSQKTKI